MIRVFVLYPEAPDQERYDEHVEFSRREVPEAAVRHGPVLGTPSGESRYAYYFEYEFADRDAWKRAREGLNRTAQDAQELGRPFEVYFAEVE